MCEFFGFISERAYKRERVRVGGRVSNTGEGKKKRGEIWEGNGNVRAVSGGSILTVGFSPVVVAVGGRGGVGVIRGGGGGGFVAETHFWRGFLGGWFFFLSGW